MKLKPEDRLIKRRKKMDTNIYKKLSQIQIGLKAPKGQYNSFGDYKYRSCEDILEALKEQGLLVDTQTAIVLSDEPILIGNYQYIKAVAKLIDTETGQEVTATAYAREPAEKKKMDAAQITGSTSSYARKYALSGLFAIDDNKDDDSTNHGNQQQPNQRNQPQSNQRNQQQSNQRNQPQSNQRNQQEPSKQGLKNEIVQILQAKNIPLERMTKYLKERYATDQIMTLNLAQMKVLVQEVASW